MAEDGEIASDVQLKRCRGKTCPTPQDGNEPGKNHDGQDDQPEAEAGQDEKDLQKDTEAEQNEQEGGGSKANSW